MPAPARSALAAILEADRAIRILASALEAVQQQAGPDQLGRRAVARAARWLDETASTCLAAIVAVVPELAAQVEDAFVSLRELLPLVWMTGGFGLAGEELVDRLIPACRNLRHHLCEAALLLRPLAGPRPLVTLPPCRLTLTEHGQVLLDGERVVLDMTAERRYDALALLAVLIKAAGDWRSSSEIWCEEGSLAGVRIDRLVRKLPAVVLKLIDSGKKKGFRLRREAWRN